MGKTYLIDTNVVSKYLRDDLPNWAMQFMDEVVENGSNISVITRIELEVYAPPTEQERQTIQEYINGSATYMLTEEIIQQTIKLRRQYRSIKRPDTIIAATAMVNDFVVLSTNDRDFMKIAGLKYRSLQ
ncbi:hypothetical protein GCM10023187_39250 [Nibrella viscosa]|uniref:PIN domain-containing protein n=1 Tax=Nibrella viscosa TaxID=1084524 RepID=A0ABP8KP83_9BACT